MADITLDRFITEFVFEDRDSQVLDNIDRRVDRLKSNLRTTGFALIGTGTALTGALYAVSRPVLAFETAMNNVQAVLGFTADQMMGLRMQAQELGATTIFTASQVANAQFELAKAGFDLNQIIALTPNVLNAAAAGQLDMAFAAEILATNIKGLDLEVTDATLHLDRLAFAASNSNTDIGQLGRLFTRVGPTVTQFGVDIDEMTASLATLLDIGLQEEIIGTGIRNLFATIAEPQFEDKARELDLTSEAIINLRRAALSGDLIGLLQNLEALDIGADPQRAFALFGREVFNVASALINGLPEVMAFDEELQTVEGTAQRMADTQMQGLPGAVAEARSAFEGLQLAIGESGLTDNLEMLADLAAGAAGEFRDLPEPVKEIIGLLLIAGPGLIALGTAFQIAAFAVGGFAIAVGGVPLAALLGTLAATGLVLAAIVIYWDEITAAVDRASDAIRRFFSIPQLPNLDLPDLDLGNIRLPFIADLLNDVFGTPTNVRDDDPNRVPPRATDAQRAAIGGYDLPDTRQANIFNLPTGEEIAARRLDQFRLPVAPTRAALPPRPADESALPRQSAPIAFSFTGDIVVNDPEDAREVAENVMDEIERQLGSLDLSGISPVVN